MRVTAACKRLLGLSGVTVTGVACEDDRIVVGVRGIRRPAGGRRCATVRRAAVSFRPSSLLATTASDPTAEARRACG